MKDKYGGSTDYSAENGSTVSSSPPLLHQERHHIVLKKQRSQQQQQQQQQCSLFNLNDRIPARLVLYFLSWSGFLVSFMMRNDINFALVAMVKTPNSTTLPSTIHPEINMTATQPINTTMASLLNDINQTLAVVNSTVSKYSEDNATVDPVADSGEFDWSSTTKAAILGSFYWCYVLSQVVGGVATQYFGTKNVFGWSQFATAVCSLGIPYAASLHYGVLIVLRSIQGFASGLTWPAMYALVGYWIPPAERSRFMSSFQGFSIGIGLTYPLCGFIIKHFGWRLVFYTTGTIGMMWCIMWYFLAFNTPAEHPRITIAEREYIEMNVSHEVRDGQGMKVPWRLIFTSLPAWSIGVTTFGRIWVHYQFIMSGPLYMKHILGFSIQQNGLLSGTPFLCSYFSSVLFCYVADLFVKRKVMSLTNVRKLFTAVSQIIPGILILIIGYIDDNIVLVLIIWFIAVTLITASYAGAMASIVDIAPNLAGPVLAFAQTIHMTASFLSPVITGFIVTNETSIEQWQHVFGVASIIAICTYVMFQIYGTADIQSWNYPQKKLLLAAEESQNLQEQQQHQQNPENNSFLK